MAKKRIWIRGVAAGAMVLVLAALTGGGILYSWIYAPNLINSEADSLYFFIRTGSTYPQVYKEFKESRWLRSDRGFDWVAKQKDYPSLVKPGRYLLLKGMSNSEIIDLLRAGRQAEINLVFNTTRHFDRLAGILSKQIEADSASLLAAFRDTALMKEFGFEPRYWPGMFIPNTYRFKWNTSPGEFLIRMNQEFNAFWNDERIERLKVIGLDKFQVITLAAIIQEETVKSDEMPRIAGVYMNRLKKGIKLQADPTVIYANGDYSIKRVLNRHLTVKSPYNTYLYAGLPPGPIRIPSIQSIDACLSFEKHDYLYFCAKEDFSGYHSFARTYGEHLVNARKYQRALGRPR